MTEFKPLVLISDDDGTFQALSRKVFEAVGYRVAVAGSGQETINLVEKDRPDMVLLDIEMPDKSGIEVCNIIRQSPNGRDIPIVMLTGNKDIDSIQRAFEVGATDFFTKPPNWVIINERVRHMLQAAKAFQQLRNNEARLAKAHAIAKLGNWEYEPATSWFSCSDSLGPLLEISGEELTLDSMLAKIDQADQKVVRDLIAQCLTRPGNETVDSQIVSNNQGTGGTQLRHICLHLQSEADEFGKVTWVRGIVQDVSERKTAQMLEAGKSRVLQMLIEQSPINQIFQEIVSVIDKQLPQSASAVCLVHGDTIDVVEGHDAAVNFLEQRKQAGHGLFNDNWYSLSEGQLHSADPEFLFDEFITHTVVPLLSGTGEIRGTLNVFCKNKGEDLTFLDQLSSLAAAVVEHYRLTNQLVHQAQHDPLTGLLNRTALMELVKVATATAETDNSKCAFLLLDLDRFKNINDTLGHQAGDTLLKIVTARLKSVIRRSDYLGRIGGDEFLLVLTELKSSEAIAKMAQRLLDAITEPYNLESRLLHLGTSIGISIFPDDGEDFIKLHKNADVAMYHAKNKGGGRFCFYRSVMSNLPIARLDIESSIQSALENNEFLLHYQPKFNMRTGEIVGLEALLRWYRPDRGFVAPAEFIPIAEESSLIVKIGDVVLEKTCRQIADWMEKFSLEWPVAVNVSAVQLTTADFAGKVKELQEKFHIPSRLLEIEITETTILKHQEEVAQNFNLFKEMGLKTTIDDFGTGYCSITYLRRVPLDCLKIDRSFVDEIKADSSSDEKALQLIKGIIGLSRNMGIEVVSEGVESDEQQRFLVDSGCEIGQGFLFCKPLPPDKIEELIVSNRVISNRFWSKQQEVKNRD